MNAVQPQKANAPTAKRDFGLLWLGQSLSLLGDQILVIALPLLAVQVFGATEAQAVLLPFALYLPFLLFGLQAGAIVDRLPRRLTMVACDSTQALVFLLITALAFSKLLSFTMLMILVGIAGTAVVFFQIAYTSFVPELYSDERNLQRSNSRLSFSESMSRILGPVVAGLIIAWTGTAAAIGFNALTFVISLLTLLMIKHRLPAPVSTAVERKPGWMRRDISEGLQFVFRHPRLEPVIMCGVVYVIFSMMIESTLVLYCVTHLGLSVEAMGFVIGAAAAGFPIGNMICGKLVNRFGVGRSLVLGAMISVSGLVLIPVAGASGSIIALIAASVLHGIGEGAFSPTALTLRQTSAPDHLLGRVNSVQRVLTWGAISLGSLVAGLATKFFGLSSALWIGGVGTILCLPVLLRRGILAEVVNPMAPKSSAVQAEN